MTGREWRRCSGGTSSDEMGRGISGKRRLGSSTPPPRIQAMGTAEGSDKVILSPEFKRQLKTIPLSERMWAWEVVELLEEFDARECRDHMFELRHPNGKVAVEFEVISPFVVVLSVQRGLPSK